MSVSLDVLIVEDSEDDALLLVRELGRNGYEPSFQRVDEALAMQAALDAQAWDIVISDCAMPRFSALAALDLIKSRGLDLPFIVVSGAVGEAVAAEVMKAGASDYVMKDNLTRLGPAIQRELAEYRVRVARRQAEKAQHASERQYRLLFESSPNLIVLLDDAGRIVDCNHAIEQFSGLTRDGVIGKSLAELRDRIGLSLEDLQNLLSLSLQGRDVSPIEVEVWDPTGKSHWLEVYIAALQMDERGLLQAIVHDVTERKLAEAERRELEDKLERARRMEALGMLAGGVAHDLNNLLGPLVAYPDLILMDMPSDSMYRPDILRIKEAAQRSAAVVQDLLTLARRGTLRMVPLDINEIVQQCKCSPSFAELMTQNPGVLIQTRLHPNLPKVMGSISHLARMLMNLLTYAFESMPAGGLLRISTAYERLDSPRLGYDYIEVGDYVILEVADTGTGIARANLERIFEPFYTKKQMGLAGSGLGLAVVYGVVQDHKGGIDIQTASGEGTRFVTYLPVDHSTILASRGSSGGCEGQETVLIVDDMSEQRLLAARLLSSLGYRVESVENGRAALSYLSTHQVDVLVLDMVMEDDFDGLDTYREVVKIHPGQRAVISSGYSENCRVTEVLQLGAGPFIRKPYTREGIGRAVRSALDS